MLIDNRKKTCRHSLKEVKLVVQGAQAGMSTGGTKADYLSKGRGFEKSKKFSDAIDAYLLDHKHRMKFSLSLSMLQRASYALSICGISLAYTNFFHNSPSYSHLRPSEDWLKLFRFSLFVFCGVSIVCSVGELFFAATWAPYLTLVDDLISIPSLALCCLSGVAIRPSGDLNTSKVLYAFLALGVFWASVDRVTHTNAEDSYEVRVAVNVVYLFGSLYIGTLMMKMRGDDTGKRA